MKVFFWPFLVLLNCLTFQISLIFAQGGEDGPFTQPSDPGDIIKVEPKPLPPAKPRDGRDGTQPGENGESTLPPDDARPSGFVDVYITKKVEGTSGTEKIYYDFIIDTINPDSGQPMTLNYRFSQDGNEKIFIATDGINGTPASRAGDAAKGETGNRGTNATRFSPGTRGGKGGPGGDGGESTNGGRGGNANRVRVFVDRDSLSALNVFENNSPGFLTGLIPGGLGGPAGFHGQGAPGGDGGPGGDDLTWYTTETYNDSEGNEQEKQVPHYMDGGRQGYEGDPGKTPTKKLLPGENGDSSNFEIHVTNPNGSTDIYRQGAFQYQVEIMALESADYKGGGVPDNILEPEEPIKVRLKVKNVGKMDSPEDLQLLIRVDFANSQDVGQNDNSIVEVTFSDVIRPGEEVILSDPIIIPIKPSLSYPYRNDVPPQRVKVAVSTFQFRKSPNHFAMSSEYAPAVMIHKITGSPTLLPGQETEVAFLMQNLSDITWGTDSESRRILEIHIQQSLQSHNPDVDLDLGDLGFTGPDGKEVSLAEAFAQSILTLEGKEKKILVGRVRLKEGTTAYRQGEVVVSLYLGALNNFLLPRNIWERNFRFQVGQTFQPSTDPRNPTKLVVFTTNRTSMGKIEFFRQFARDFGIHMADYNLSLYGGPKWELLDGFTNTVFVVLNELYDPVSSNHMPAELFGFNASLANVSKLNKSNRFLFMGSTNYGVEFQKRILPIFEIGQQNLFTSPDDFLEQLRRGAASTSVFGYGNKDVVDTQTGTLFGGKPTKEDLKKQAEEMAAKLSELYPEQRFVVTYSFNPQASGGFLKRLLVKSTLGTLGIYRSLDRNRPDINFFSTGGDDSPNLSSGSKEVYYSLFRTMSIDDLFYFFQRGADQFFNLNSDFGSALLDALVSHFANELLYVSSTSQDTDRLFPSFLALEKFSTNQSFSDAKINFINHFLATLEFMIKPDASFVNNTVNNIMGLFVTSDKRKNLDDLLQDIKSKRVAGKEDQVEAILLAMRNAYNAAEEKPVQNALFKRYLNLGGYQAFQGTEGYFSENLVIEDIEWEKLVAAYKAFDEKADRLRKQEEAMRRKNLGEPLSSDEQSICALFGINVLQR